MMLWIKKILILFVLLLMSACGYHLRGNMDLLDELRKVYFQDASKQLRKIARKTIRSSAGVLVDNSNQAGVIVQVVKEKMETRVLSLSAIGRANEYEVIYYLDFILFDAEGKQISEIQNIELRRDYFNEQVAILAKDHEENVIREELYRQAVQSIIYRSRIALKKNNQ